MFVKIQTNDGQVYSSDPVSIAESGLSPVEWDEAVTELEGLLKRIGEASYFSLDIGGRTKYFNPANITWAEVCN